MERAEISLEAMPPAEREKIRALIDKQDHVSLARRWGLDPETLGRAALGRKVSRGTRALIAKGLESEAK